MYTNPFNARTCKGTGTRLQCTQRERLYSSDYCGNQARTIILFWIATASPEYTRVG